MTSEPGQNDSAITRPKAVAKALEIFNDSWAFAVLQEVFFGVRKFDDFQRNLNISRSVLTRRLKHLVEQGIVSKALYSSRPKRYEYRLTEKGKDMYPIFILLKQWGDKWLDIEQCDFHLTHKHCGNDLKVNLTCQHCHGNIEAKDVMADSE